MRGIIALGFILAVAGVSSAAIGQGSALQQEMNWKLQAGQRDVAAAAARAIECNENAQANQMQARLLSLASRVLSNFDNFVRQTEAIERLETSRGATCNREVWQQRTTQANRSLERLSAVVYRYTRSVGLE